MVALAPNDDVFEFGTSRLHDIEDHAFSPQSAERIDKLEARISVAAQCDNHIGKFVRHQRCQKPGEDIGNAGIGFQEKPFSLINPERLKRAAGFLRPEFSSAARAAAARPSAVWIGAMEASASAAETVLPAFRAWRSRR